jgi:hypothetical protein
MRRLGMRRGAVGETRRLGGHGALADRLGRFFDPPAERRSYNETGSPGVVVILLMWFWLSASIVLLGAELSCEIERQTARYDHRAAQAEGWARRLCRRYRRRKRDAGL